MPEPDPNLSFITAGYYPDAPDADQLRRWAGRRGVELRNRPEADPSIRYAAQLDECGGYADTELGALHLLYHEWRSTHPDAAAADRVIDLVNVDRHVGHERGGT